MAEAGGTSVPEPRSGGGWLAFALVAPIAAWLVHRISSGDECGWDYGSLGGACRAIILLSVIAGGVAGWLALVCARGKRWAGFAAAGVVALATLACKQFQDYRHELGSTMDAETCTWVNHKLMTCVRDVYGENAEQMTRHAQDGCIADDKSYTTYRGCMPIDDCAKMLECVAHGMEHH